MSSPRELLELFLTERSLYVAELTVRQDRFHLVQFLRYLEQELSVAKVEAVRFEHLEAFCRRLEAVPGKRGKTASSATRTKAMQVCRLFLIWAYEKGLTLTDFELYPLPHRVRVKPMQVPTPEQVRKLLEVPDRSSPSGRRDHLILESFYSLALRRRESHRLSLSDLNLHNRTLRVVGKKSRERLMPLTERLAELFADYLKETRPFLRPFPGEDALWISPQTGKRLSFTYLRVIVVTCAEKAGLVSVGPHLLRHAAATHMLKGGAELVDIQRYLGHSSPDSLQVYTRVEPEELRRALQASHPRHGVKRDED